MLVSLLFLQLSHSCPIYEFWTFMNVRLVMRRSRFICSPSSSPPAPNLRLNNNNIRAARMAALSPHFPHLPYIQTLNFSHNHIRRCRDHCLCYSHFLLFQLLHPPPSPSAVSIFLNSTFIMLVSASSVPLFLISETWTAFICRTVNSGMRIFSSLILHSRDLLSLSTSSTYPTTISIMLLPESWPHFSLSFSIYLASNCRITKSRITVLAV